MSFSKKRELIALLVCFSGATILHVVIAFKQYASLREVFYRFHWVVLMTIVFYGLSVILRILYDLISRFWMRK